MLLVSQGHFVVYPPETHGFCRRLIDRPVTIFEVLKILGWDTVSLQIYHNISYIPRNHTEFTSTIIVSIVYHGNFNVIPSPGWLITFSWWLMKYVSLQHIQLNYCKAPAWESVGEAFPNPNRHYHITTVVDIENHVSILILNHSSCPWSMSVREKISRWQHTKK